MSLNSTVASTRSLEGSPTPTTFALVHSRVTHGSSPMTLASWPAGISYAESGGISRVGPSTISTRRRPEIE